MLPFGDIMLPLVNMPGRLDPGRAAAG